ncbi:MAG TPA: START-like domain-containing protein [Paludibacter sp.]|nr:START-like domain-containing protein [Paludibacter sp.]
MKKDEFKIEYQLKTASINILWNSISTPLGLTEWFADGVTVNDSEFTFSWEKNEQTAFLIQAKPNVSVRYQWEEDSDTDYFFELKIEILEVTGELALIITDFAEKNEKDDLILIWNKQIEILRRKTGI